MNSVDLLLQILDINIFKRKHKLIFIMNSIRPNYKNYRVAKLSNLYDMNLQIFLKDSRLIYKFSFKIENVDHNIEFMSKDGVLYNEINFRTMYEDFVNFLENTYYKNNLPKNIIKIVSRIKRDYVRG